MWIPGLGFLVLFFFPPPLMPQTMCFSVIELVIELVSVNNRELACWL